MKQLLRRHGRTHLPGGSDPIPGFPTGSEFAQYQANASVVTNSPTGFEWELFTGTEFLDLSNAFLPTIVTAGVYAVTANLTCTSGEQPGEFAWAALDLNSFNAPSHSYLDPDPFSNFVWPLARVNSSSPGNLPEVTLHSGFYLPEGATVQCQVKHAHGSDLNFTMAAYVQRIL